MSANFSRTDYLPDSLESNFKHARDLVAQFIVGSGRDILAAWQSVKVVATEDSGKNVSTNFDKKIERDFYDLVSSNFAEHGFQGEEFPQLNRDADLKWYIDPIDGSKWFAKGIPLWCMVITLVYESAAVLCFVYNPVSDQLYFAEKGKGAYLNGTRLRVDSASTKSLNDIQLAWDFPVSDKIATDFKQQNELDQNFASYRDRMYELLADFSEVAYRVRDIGSGPLGISWVAQRYFGAFVSPLQSGSKIVDHLGPLLIATESDAIVHMEDYGSVYRFWATQTKELSAEIQTYFEKV